MALSKNTIVDKAETVKILNHYCIQVREVQQIIESGKVISSNFHRHVLQPDANVSSITDPTVKAQFEAVMTDTVKENYTAFLEKQK
jgi:phage gp16-like protein